LTLTVNPLLAGPEQKVGFLILGTEVTDKKVLETQLAFAQKMKSIGQLAAGIAHEINTPLQYVNDNLQFLQDSFLAIDTHALNDLVLLDTSCARPASQDPALNPALPHGEFSLT